MRLTTKGRYAVTAMLDLAFHSKYNPITLTEIAARQTISLSYLEQLFSRLRKAGIVQGVRGPGGGYQLRLLPEHVNISMIMDAVNEPIDSTRCRGEANCQHEGTCLTHDLWIDLNDHIDAYLSNITLADLLRKREDRQRIEQSPERVLVMKKVQL